MSAKKLQKFGRKLFSFFSLETWKLLLILIFSFFLIATCLRVNHLKMAELRSDVLAADKLGNDALLASALTELQTFTLRHIVVNLDEHNGVSKLEFGTGVFYLEHSYLRAASAAISAASELEVDDSNPNGNIYAQASAVCQPRAIAGGWTWDSAEYIGCFTDELSKYPASSFGDGTLRVELPSTELYRREFVSPVWTFSLTGLLILFNLIISVVILTRFLIWLILEISLFVLKKP